MQWTCCARELLTGTRAATWEGAAWGSTQKQRAWRRDFFGVCRAQRAMSLQRSGRWPRFSRLRSKRSLTARVHGESARALFATVANTPSYGAGVKIAPDALVDDGLLNLVLIGALTVPQVLELIPRILRTGDLRMPEIQRFTARRVCLRAGSPATFHGDGEIIGAAPVEVEVVPGAIRVLAPNRSAEI